LHLSPGHTHTRARTHAHTHTHTERDRHRHRHTDTHRQTDRQTHTQVYIHTAKSVAPRKEARPQSGQRALAQVTSSDEYIPASLKLTTMLSRCVAEKGKPGRRLRSSGCLQECRHICTTKLAYIGQNTTSQSPSLSSRRQSRFSLKTAEREACASELKWPILALSDGPPTPSRRAHTHDTMMAASAIHDGENTIGQGGPTPGAPVSINDKLAATSSPPSRSSKASHLSRSSDEKQRWPTTERSAGAMSHAAWRTPPRTSDETPRIARVSMVPRANRAS